MEYQRLGCHLLDAADVARVLAIRVNADQREVLLQASDHARRSRQVDVRERLRTVAIEGKSPLRERLGGRVHTDLVDVFEPHRGVSVEHHIINEM